VEIKSVEQIGKAHTKQLLTYLKLADMRVGLLINFGAPTLRDGLHRVVNNLSPSASPRLRVNTPGLRMSQSEAGPASPRLRVNQGSREITE
jgi:hypothetical protein